MHPAHRAFQSWLRRRSSAVIGQVWIRGGSRYELRHELDREISSGCLKLCHVPQAAREISLSTNDGRFRPLKSAPNLRRGWRIVGLDFDGLVSALEIFYPAAIAHWQLARRGRLTTTHYRECAERQTGMYRITTKLTDEQIRRVAGCGCAAGECLKVPHWEVDGRTGLEVHKPTDGNPDRINIPCPEPCSLLMSLARKAVRLEQEEPMAVKFTKSDLELIGTVLRGVLDGGQRRFREGDYNDPRHRQRIRYFLEKHNRLFPKRRAQAEKREE